MAIILAVITESLIPCSNSLKSVASAALPWITKKVRNKTCRRLRK
jgi:hypothetical protein